MEEVKVRSYMAIYYDNRIKNDPEYYAKEKKRITEYMVNRSRNDEEYRKRRSETALRSYYKKKELLRTQNIQAVN